MSTDRSVSIHVPRFALWLLAVLLIAPWIVFGGWLWSHADRAAAVTASSPAATARSAGNVAAKDIVQTHRGPWGNLQSFRILIEPPEEFILRSYLQPKLRPWIFKGYTESSLAALLQGAGLNTDQLAFIANAAHREVRSDAIVIQPDSAFISGLSSSARTRLYAALGEFPENVSQYNPFRLRSSLAAGWLDNSDLPEDAIALTKKMLYPRGTATCFSDEAIVLPTIPEDGDRVKYIKALSRKSGLLVYLNVRPGEDVDKLVNYWGRSGRSKDLRPLLQSLARLPNGGTIDIVHLLPRFARLLTYTYPLPSERPVDANHDCHWSSFNFENDEPDERYSNIDYVRQVLLDRYYPVPGAPTLGDIIMFVREDGVVIHSCVYIADDIVFTKNGPAFSVPWLLSPLADVQAFYAENPGVEIRRFRAKNL